MDQRYRFLLKNTMLLTIGNFSSKILVFLMVPLYTSVLTTEEYGIYDLCISTVQLLIPILTINIVDSVMRYSMDRNFKKEDVATIGVKYLVLSIFSFGVILLSNAIFGLWDEVVNYTGYVFLYYISYIANHMLIQFAKALEKVREIAIAGVMSTVVTITCNLLFLLVFNWRLEGFFGAYILGQFVPVLYLLCATEFNKCIKRSINKRLEKEMVNYSLPLIMTNLAWNINNVSDRYVVTLLCGITINGIYSVSYKIPMVISTIQSIFTQAWSISAIKEYDDVNRDDFYQNMFLYLNAIMCIGGTVLIFLTKPIAHILYAKEFFEAWQYVPFLVVSCIINSSAGYIGQILAAKKDSKAMAKAAVYGALVNIILNVVLIYFIGAQGAAIATAISSFVIFYYRKKSLDEVLKIKRYNTVLLMWLVLSVQSLILIYIGDIVGQVICIALIMYLARGQVIQILKRIITFKKRT